MGIGLGGAAGQWPYDPNYNRSGAGRFNENVKIDTSRVNVAPPGGAGIGRTAGKGELPPPGGMKPGGMGGGPSPYTGPPIPDFSQMQSSQLSGASGGSGPSVGIRNGGNTPPALLRQLQSDVDSWIRSVPWERMHPNDTDPFVKSTVSLMAAAYGIGLTW